MSDRDWPGVNIDNPAPGMVARAERLLDGVEEWESVSERVEWGVRIDGDDPDFNGDRIWAYHRETAARLTVQQQPLTRTLMRREITERVGEWKETP